MVLKRYWGLAGWSIFWSSSLRNDMYGLQILPFVLVGVIPSIFAKPQLVTRSSPVTFGQQYVCPTRPDGATKIDNTTQSNIFVSVIPIIDDAFSLTSYPDSRILVSSQNTTLRLRLATPQGRQPRRSLHIPKRHLQRLPLRRLQSRRLGPGIRIQFP